MALKNFIRHTRPKGKKQIEQAVADYNRQLLYETALGHTENLSYLTAEINQLQRRLMAKELTTELKSE